MEPDHEDRDGGLDEMGPHPGVATMEPGHDRVRPAYEPHWRPVMKTGKTARTNGSG